jgi:hypothetical protein
VVPPSSGLRPRASSEPARQFTPLPSALWTPPKPGNRPRGYTSGYAARDLPPTPPPLTHSVSQGFGHSILPTYTAPVILGPPASSGTAAVGIGANSAFVEKHPLPTILTGLLTASNSASTQSNLPIVIEEPNEYPTPPATTQHTHTTSDALDDTVNMTWLGSRLTAKGLPERLIEACEEGLIHKMGIDSEMAYVKYPSEKLNAAFWREAGITLRGQQVMLTELHKELQKEHYPTQISGKEEFMPTPTRARAMATQECCCVIC